MFSPHLDEKDALGHSIICHTAYFVAGEKTQLSILLEIVAVDCVAEPSDKNLFSFPEDLAPFNVANVIEACFHQLRSFLNGLGNLANVIIRLEVH